MRILVLQLFIVSILSTCSESAAQISLERDSLSYGSPSSEFPLRISIGAYGGYAFVSMGDVNSYLDEIASQFRDAGADANRIVNEQFGGGFDFDLMLMARYKRFLLGAIYSSLSTVEGRFSYADASGNLAEMFSASAFDLMPFVGVRAFGSSVVVLDLIAGIGYGKASVDYSGELRIVAQPSRNITLRWPLEGNYLAGRLAANLSFIVKQARLGITVGYRFADAGAIKGKQTFNGQTSDGEYPFKYRNKEYGFDFSGFQLRAGVAVEF